jgi:peptidase A4-like protein
VRWAAPILVLALVALTPSAQAPTARPIVVVAANQSFNWAGYVQGALEKNTTFHSVSARWIVPTATPRRPGEAEYSSSWIGIGGGCVDAACSIGDGTLIQAGIGHDIDETGAADYYAWWETIPAPLVRTTLPVRPGDRIAVSISEGRVPELWTILIANRSTGSKFTITLPYPSSYATAEWVIETPLVITETGIQVGPMPNLTTVRFDHARANGASARFIPAERMELVDFDLDLIATPSLPDRKGDGFNDCTYTATCSAP